MSSDISSDGEIRIIFTKITSNSAIELRNFFRSCLIEDFYEIDEIRDEFKNNFKIFLGISRKTTSSGRDKWKACCVIEDEKFSVRSSSYEKIYEKVDEAFDDFCNVMKNFNANIDDDGSHTIIDALKAIEVFSYEIIDEMSKTLIDVGLDEKFRTKEFARKFVEILKNFIDAGNEVKVNENQLENLIHILTSENFAYDEGKVQLQTLSVLKNLKLKNFANFSQENLESIQKFLEENRNAYVSDISLRMRSRDKNIRASIEHFMQCRVDFLTSMVVFGGKIYEEDLLEVLTIKNSKSSLKEKEEELEKVSEEIRKIKRDQKSKRSALIGPSNTYNELQKEVNQLKEIESFKSEVKIEEFLIELGKVFQKDSKGLLGFFKDAKEKFFGETEDDAKNVPDESQNRSKMDRLKGFMSEKYSQLKEKSQKILNAPKKEEVPPLVTSLLEYTESHMLSQDEARSILSILTKLDFSSFEDIPKNILSAFEDEEDDEGYESNSSDDEGSFHDQSNNIDEQIIVFGLEKSLSNPKNYLEFISKLATEGKNEEKVRKALQKYESSLSDQPRPTNDKLSISELFKAIDENKVTNVFGKLNGMIKSNQKLPNRAFEYLKRFPNDQKTFEVLNKVLEADSQKVPEDLIQIITREMNKLEVEITSKKTQFAKLLIIRNLAKIGDIESFCIKALKVETEEALKIIYNAIQADQKISRNLLNQVRSLKASKSTQNLINFITKVETKLSKLTSGKASSEEKFEILKDIEEDLENFQDDASIEILINLVLYDENVARRAFEVLTRTIKPNFKLKDEELCKVVLSALRCNARFETIDAFLEKFILDINQLIEECEDESLRAMLNEAFDAAKFIELSYKSLENILTSSEKLYYDEILMLLSALEDEKFAKYFKRIINTLNRTKLNDKALDNIKFILNEYPNHSMYNEILDLLPNEVRKNFKELKSKPELFIENAIKQLLNGACPKGLLDRQLLQNFTEDHLRTLKQFCHQISKEIEPTVQKLYQNNTKRRKIAKKIETISENTTNEALKNEMLEQCKDLLHKLDAEYKKLCPIFEKPLSSLLVVTKVLSTFGVDDEEFSKVFLKQIFKTMIIEAKTVESPQKRLKLSVALLHLIYFNLPVKKNIFTIFPSTEWSLQVLIQVLLALCENYNDFELEDLATTVKKVQRDRNELLITIIEKVEGKRFKLRKIIDLIVILESDVKYFEKFRATDDDQIIPARVHESWLKSILLEKCVGENLQDFKIVLSYRPTLIAKLLNADTNNELKVENFIRIFKSLQLCSISYEEKCSKLTVMSAHENTTWLSAIELFVIENLVRTKLKHFDVKKFNIFLQRIYHIGWSINSIIAIVKKLRTQDDIANMTSSLRTLYEYQISELHSNAKGERALEVITNESDYPTIQKRLYEIVIHNTFGPAHKKTVEDLCNEINANNPELKLQLMAKFERVQAAYDSVSKVIEKDSPIKEWNKKDIKNWSRVVKVPRKPQLNGIDDLLINVIAGPTSPLNSQNVSSIIEDSSDLKILSRKPSIYETIAILMRALEIFKGYEPREIQILSVLILLNPDECKGRLAQINTGEGKTTIVAMLAVIKALAGHTVDVITSSPELAKPQANELQNFYEMFGLTVAHNGNDPVDKSIRYKSDIVYGAATDFQGDILRDEYSKLGTRSGRRCDFAIVDEVDSMLIDGRKHIVMLSSSMPAMNYLEPIYAVIWSQVKIFAQAVKEKDGRYFLVQNNAISEDGNTNEDSKEVWMPLNGTKESFIKDKLIDSLKKELEKGDESNLKVPRHLRELIIEYQLDQWISCAIYGKYHSKNNQNYVLEKGKIVPVDSDNTGVLQESMNWSNGLHQFLQIKHGAKITPESLTTNYISNVAFFKRYGSNLFGLTGTLGSESATKLLEKTYNVDSVIIPPFMTKRFKELSAIIESNEKDWYEEIVESNMNHLRNQRAVLIITRYISEAKELLKRFSEKFEMLKWKASKIREYKTNHESKAVHEEVGSGDLIIATNIAGRGTDIKTSKNVEANGGLHVCVISLPSNERVEQQNVGRTSRTGNLGTSQFIIYHKYDSDIAFMKSYRDELENQDLTRAEQEMQKTLVKDEVFLRFCELLGRVPINTTRKAIEDRFGIWLQRHGETSENLEEEFEKFEEEINEDLAKDEVIKNPVFHIQLGNKYLKDEAYKKALEHFTKAIDLEGEFSEIAYYNRGYARLALSCGGTVKIGETEENKREIEKCVKDFEKAREKIKNREAELQIIQAAKEEGGKVLSEQVAHKLVLYGMQKSAIDQAIGVDASEHKEAMDDMNEQKKKLEAKLEELPEVKAKFSKVENLGEKLEKLEEQKEKLVKEKKDLKEISDQIENILSSKEYEDYVELKRLLDIPENLAQLEKQINAEKTNFESSKDGLITKALREKIDMKIEIKEISKSLPEDQDVNLYKEEIEEFSANGMLGAFKVTHLPPINWGAVLGVLALGVGQMLLGGALFVFTVGAGVALASSMLMEGISDVFTAVKDGIINRSFSWVQYGIQKAISYVTSILCMGMAALKDAAKTTMAGLKNIGKAMTEVTKRGWTVVAKKIGLEIGKKIGTEVVQGLINFGIDRALLPLISESITAVITPKIIEHLQSNKIVEKWLKLDEQNRNKKYQAIIMRIAQEIISREQAKGTFTRFAEGIADYVGCRDEMDNNVDSIKEGMNKFAKDHETAAKISQTTGEIVGGVADRVASQKLKYYDAIKKAMEAHDILKFTGKFLKEFEKDIKKENDRIGTENENKEETNSFVQVHQREQTEVQNSDDIIQQSTHERTQFDRYQDAGQMEEDFLIIDQTEVQVELENSKVDSKSVFEKVGGMVSKQITQRINGNFIAPYACSLASKSINYLSENWDNALSKEVETFKAENRTEIRQNKDKDNRLDDDKNKAHEDPEIMAEVEEEIADVEEGAKIGLQHLGSVCDANGVQIIVYDENGNLVRTIGEGRPVEVRYKEGHYSLKNGKDPEGGSAEMNDCLFNVIAHELGNPDEAAQMRAKTVEALKKNKNTLAHQHADVQFLKTHKPEILHEGGLVLTPTSRAKVENYVNSLKERLQRDGYDEETIKGVLENVDTYISKTGMTNVKIIDLRRRGIVDFHHIPAVGIVLKGYNITDYDDKNSSRNGGLVIAVDAKDHAKLLTTKRNCVAYHNASVKEIKEKGKEGFKNVVMRDLIDLHKTSKETGHAEYQKTMLQFADKYLKTGDITPQGAEQIRSMVNGLPQTNFNSDYLIKNNLYTFDKKNDADRILRNRLDGLPLDAPW